MIRSVLLTILSVFMFYACADKADNPKKAAEDIVEAYNNRDTKRIWERTLPEDKEAVRQNFRENADNLDLMNMMAQASDTENMTADNVTEEEYLFAMFKMIFGKNDMKLINIEQDGVNSAIVNLQIGEKRAIMPLVKQNGFWYMKVN